MKNREVAFILYAFLVWRIFLVVVIFFAVRFLPLQDNFLGGDLERYLSNPFFWAFGNFDGQHYVNIAQNGYGFGEYTFFPLYPLLVRFLGGLLGGGFISYYLSGQIISNISLLIALFGFYKLARIDYPEKIAKLAVVLVLVFPTSFYFAGVYTESLFLALLVWTFYFFLNKKYFIAGFFAMLLSALRPVGIIIFPALIIEWLFRNFSNRKRLSNLPFGLILSPVGLGFYMYYLKLKAGDALSFFSSQVYVGEHRSRQIILFPQIIYRYIIKILPNLNYGYFPGVFFTYLEFLIGIIHLVITLLLFKYSRPGYAVFSFLAYLTPTFLGSFSSQPRYVLVLFPVYFLLAEMFVNRKLLLFAFYLVSIILLVISFALFARGYWIS